MARVHIYQHQSNNTFRVVGRLMTDQSVSIFCDVVFVYKVSDHRGIIHLDSSINHIRYSVFGLYLENKGIVFKA